MQLIDLQTTNFKKLGSRLINFTAGVNFICGDNGQANQPCYGLWQPACSVRGWFPA